MTLVFLPSCRSVVVYISVLSRPRGHFKAVVIWGSLTISLVPMVLDGIKMALDQRADIILCHLARSARLSSFLLAFLLLFHSPGYQHFLILLMQVVCQRCSSRRGKWVFWWLQSDLLLVAITNFCELECTLKVARKNIFKVMKYEKDMHIYYSPIRTEMCTDLVAIVTIFAVKTNMLQKQNQL